MSDQNNDSPNLRFTVMPDLEGIGSLPTAQKEAAKPAPSAPVTPPSAPSAPSAPPPSPTLTAQLREYKNVEVEAGLPSRRRKKIIVASIVVAALAAAAAGGFWAWQKYSSQSEAKCENGQKCNEAADNDAALPNDNQETSQSGKTSVDEDSDGLLDSLEQELGTSVNDPDSDGDGLSDGDEQSLFKTSPFTPYTDEDSFNDGKELLDFYSPLAGGEAKISEELILQIAALLAENKLHEPTIGTLLGNPAWQARVEAARQSKAAAPPPAETPMPPAANGPKFSYQDEAYGYQAVLPGDWKKTAANNVTTFIEQNSQFARFVSVQALAPNTVSVESEIRRLAKSAVEGNVTFREVMVGGLPAARLLSEFLRETSSGSIRGASLEYILANSKNEFVVTASCMSESSQSCLASLEQLSSAIEKDFRF